MADLKARGVGLVIKIARDVAGAKAALELARQHAADKLPSWQSRNPR